MAGEATDSMLALATQGAARLARTLLIVQDRYGVPTPEMEELSLTLTDAYEELDSVGHIYDENCQRPFCQQARIMLQRAMETVMAGGPMESAQQSAQG